MRRSLLRSVAATLSFRLVVVLSVSILVLFGVYTVLVQHFQSQTTERLVKNSAYSTSDIIRQSLYAAMLRNEPDRIRDKVALLGTEPGIEAIRLYDTRGVIAFSSAAREVGLRVDRQAPVCRVCHAEAGARPLAAVPAGERARIIRQPDGHRVLGLVNPIPNEPACARASCHAHAGAAPVLGVLDVQLSLASVDAEAAATRRRALALAAGVGLLSVALFGGIVYPAVHLPTRRQRRATERLAEGDLSVYI